MDSLSFFERCGCKPCEAKATRMCHLGDVAVHNRINEDNRPEEINFLWKNVFKKTEREIKTPRLEISLTKESVSASAASTGMTNELQLCATML